MLSPSEPGLTAGAPRLARSVASREVWIIEPRSAGLLARGREVWRSHHLLRFFAAATLRRTYRATLLGWPWLIIRPLVPVLIATLICLALFALLYVPLSRRKYLLPDPAVRTGIHAKTRERHDD